MGQASINQTQIFLSMTSKDIVLHMYIEDSCIQVPEKNTWDHATQQMFQAQGLPLVENEWKQVKKVGVDRIREALQP